MDYKQYVDPFSDSGLSIDYNDSYDEANAPYFEMKLTNFSISNSVTLGIQSLNFDYYVSLSTAGYGAGYLDFINDKDEAYEAITYVNITDEEWSQYGYQYTGYMRPSLTLRDYPDITFELPTVKSKPQTYTPSN